MFEEIAIDTAGGVFAGALHLGVSAGWHCGTAISNLKERIKSDEDWTRRELSWRFFMETLQAYDVGVGLMVVGAAALTGTTQWPLLGLLILTAFGAGLAYSDRNDHPPEKIWQFARKQVFQR